MAAHTTLIALHGYTLNGVQMKAAMGALDESLAAKVERLCPDGPHVCEPESVDRLYSIWQVPRLPPPYLSWWDATDDGRIHRGWEKTRDNPLVKAPAAQVFARTS